jgi:hypothetical protein
VLAVLANRFCNAAICQRVALNPRLTAYYSVRERLVAHPATPHAHAMKFVHYLYWNDLLRMSTNVRIAPSVRRAIDLQLLNKIAQMTLGERISMARTCSREVAKALLFDPSARVFAALLNNPRLNEDDLVYAIGTGRCSAEQLRLVSEDRKWSYRLTVRRALVLNPGTPRAIAASQLRHFTRQERERLMTNPSLSLYLRRCIERMEEERETPKATGKLLQ